LRTRKIVKRLSARLRDNTVVPGAREMSKEDIFQVIEKIRTELTRLREVEKNFFRLKEENQSLLLKLNENNTEPRSISEPFHFSLSLGQYLDSYASNPKELIDTIKVVPAQSLEFHMKRHDFEAWLKSIRAEDIASAIKMVGNEDLSGEDLRRRLIEAINGLPDYEE
jgi:hypothetical protein